MAELSDVETLRLAAQRMRERAGGATQGRWSITPCCEGAHHEILSDTYAMAGDVSTTSEDAEHIASWDPAVALAVADLLDGTANSYEQDGMAIEPTHFALKLARTYLRVDS